MLCIGAILTQSYFVCWVLLKLLEDCITLLQGCTRCVMCEADSLACINELTDILCGHIANTGTDTILDSAVGGKP